MHAVVFSYGIAHKVPDFNQDKPSAVAEFSESSSTMHPAELAERFRGYFGVDPTLFSAPGRVNLIGEHTDYNDGFVMPAAIEYRTRVGISPRADRKLTIRSEQIPERFEIDLDHLPAHRLGQWSDYVLGVAVMLNQRGCSLRGANILVDGEVPIGAGLSSSAALEVASALAFLSLNEASLPLPEIAKLCQKAENEFVGARVGIMDQFVSCLGKAEHALFLDCRSLDSRLVPVPDSVRLVICNTMVKHAHSTGEYNRRREQCDHAVRLLSKKYPEIRALRDVTLEQLEASQSFVPEVEYKRSAHVVRENQRVLEAEAALAAHDLSAFGDLMRKSHKSLRDLYEVSCEELDIMVEVAEGLPGYRGGRMTGGGFGGCTINLVDTRSAQPFVEQIAAGYQAKTKIRPDVYVCSPAEGVQAETDVVAQQP
jgi:galactokinase